MTAMHDPLEISITATHDVLDTRLSTAEFSRPDARNPLARFLTTDTFLASASRHFPAAHAVLGVAYRQHLSDGVGTARQPTAPRRLMAQVLPSPSSKYKTGAKPVRTLW